MSDLIKILIKAQKVIQSCQTFDQLAIANSYIKIAERKIATSPEFSQRYKGEEWETLSQIDRELTSVYNDQLELIANN